MIGFFERIIHWQNESKGLLNFTKTRSDDPEKVETTEAENGIEEENLEEVHEKTLSGQAKEEKEFHPYKFVLICIALWFLVIIAGTIVYFVWSVQLSKDSTEMMLYANNLEKHGCGKYRYDESFHNKMIVSCGLITFHIASMIIFTQRKRIGCQLCANYKLQDGSNISSNRRVAFY